jgi:hypothetical protein
MEVRVRSATMKVDDGMAEDIFELTTLNGSPLSDARAEDVVERVRSFVMHCAPKTTRAVEWRNGPILISNKNKGNETTVTVLESGTRVGAHLPPMPPFCHARHIPCATIHHASIDMPAIPRPSVQHSAVASEAYVYILHSHTQTCFPFSCNSSHLQGSSSRS